jgi:aminoglycoside phosphotransferase (APT) family kinase protein
VADEKLEWQRAQAPLDVPLDTVRAIFARALPGRALDDVSPIAGGLSNTLYRLRTAGLNDTFVLRFYTRDCAACRKEVHLHRLLRGTVPVPEIIYAEPEAAPPYAVMRWVDGPTFREIRQGRDAAAIAQCARSIGQTLAHIASSSFPPEIGAPAIHGRDVIPRLVEQFLEAPAARHRLEPEARDGIREYIRRRASRLRDFDAERSLVHSDFGSPNLVMKQPGGRWEVAAVLDWEFAFAGSPLCDIGHILRYERCSAPRMEPPHFSIGFREGGGSLPGDWRDLSRAMDLTALLEFLSRSGLPDSVQPEIVELVMATVEGRDTR